MVNYSDDSLEPVGVEDVKTCILLVKEYGFVRNNGLGGENCWILSFLSRICQLLLISTMTD